MSSSTEMKITMRRLQNEVKLLEKDPVDYIDTYPDENNMFIWYFLVRGQEKSDYEGGCYIGKIMLSQGYPKTPVDFMMLTPNGRFSANNKICLTNSGYHAEQWTPMWNMGVILRAFLSIMLADDTTGISHIKESSPERKQKAKDSFNYNMTNYKELMPKFKRFIVINEDGSCRLRTSVELKMIEDEKKKKEEERKNKKKEKQRVKDELNLDEKVNTIEENDEKCLIQQVEEKKEVKEETVVKKEIVKEEEQIEEPIKKPKKRVIKKKNNEELEEKPKKKTVKKVIVKGKKQE